MDHLKITVVTPSYNQVPFLERTLKSVHDQAYPNLEHIVIDGGSTDGSAEILRKYQNGFAYWVSEKDQGQTEALIKGFKIATGSILCWLNSDDLFEPWTLAEVAQFFSDHPDAQVVYGNSTWIDVDDRPIRPKKEHPFNRFIWLHDYNFIPQPSTFWRRGIYEEVGGLDPRFDLAMDADLWIRFAERTKIYHVRRPWSRIRFYPEQKNIRFRTRSNWEDKCIRRRYIGDQSASVRRLGKLAAKSMRIVWKLASGCYW